MSRVLYVFLGGGLGSVARYLTAIAAVRFVSSTFPFGTLFVNLIGCFCIGFVHSIAMQTVRLSPDARIFLTTGVMGGLTTYSAFNYETLVLLGQGHMVRATLYVTATVLGCAGAGVLGVLATRSLVRFF